MINRFNSLGIGCMILIASACGTAKKTTSPVSQPIVKTLAPLTESVIHIPVKVVIKPFLQQAEQLAPKEITSEGWPAYMPSGCDFRYKYRFLRAGFQFSCLNNRVTMNMNGKYQIAGSKTVCVLGQSVSPWINGSCGFGDEPMRRVAIQLVSDLKFTADYRLQTSTRVEKVQAVDKCVVTVFNNDVTQQVMDSIAASVNFYGKEIDNNLRNLRFDEVLNPLAEKAGKKIPLSTYGYMKLNANSVKLGAINLTGDTLRFTAGISCFPEISSDSVNTSVTRHLPPLTGVVNGDGFTLTTNAVYDYLTIDTLLTRTLRNRSFDVKGEKIMISSVEVSGLDQYKVRFKISFTGTKKGTLFLTGTPELNLHSQQLEVPDLEYDLNSSSLVLAVGKTFFNRQILENLRQQAKINVRDLYLKIKPKLMHSLTVPSWKASL
ncbi:MAG: hypothetical protein A1D16_07845 [Flavihumibacter sp. CACIAM 22H1]|nr:DUF4403 family protein [Flavihumibacter sp. CACIAM 22H1]KYP14894.1 MAG: hypothetical protein A1D16_07845 [Flavihumibacter sp. CACIAM 22H1]